MAEGGGHHAPSPPTKRRRPWWLLVLALVLVAAGSGVLLLDLTGREEPDPRRDPAAVPPPPGLELPEPAAVESVAPPLTATAVDAAAVRQALGATLRDPRLGDRVAVAVGPVDALGAEPVLAEGPAVVTPASTLKLLTAVAALETLGPEATFTTRTVIEGSALTLVGGGDPLLGRSATPERYPVPADLDTLARLTAEQLTAQGVRRVSLRFDTSLFAGPPVSPQWEPDYVVDDVVSPVVALWVDEGREQPGKADRVEDPARAAATVFAEALGRHGIEVAGPPLPGGAPTAAAPVAEVQGPPVVALVQHLLEVSDNEATEVLARHVALAEGLEPSFAGATRALRAVADRLGVRVDGAVLHDASGLARTNRLPVHTLLDLLAVAADQGRPELAGAVAGLPVAGWSGSLRGRFTGTEASPPEGQTAQVQEALGEVRAKTGTLTGVNGLAGVVTGRDGTVMGFVALADRVPVEFTFLVRDRLDRAAAALAGCACGAGSAAAAPSAPPTAPPSAPPTAPPSTAASVTRSGAPSGGRVAAPSDAARRALPGAP